MVDFTRRQVLSQSVAAALGASVIGVASGEEVEESDTPGAPSVEGELKRFSTTAFGAEVTGPFVFQDGSLLYSLQHPEEENPDPFGTAGIGYFSGFQFELDGNNDDFDELSTPQTEAEQRRVRSGNGDYTVFAQGRDEINGGEERLGVTQTAATSRWTISRGHSTEPPRRTPTATSSSRQTRRGPRAICSPTGRTARATSAESR
jgi:secreted PhoX family phosphatase